MPSVRSVAALALLATTLGACGGPARPTTGASPRGGRSAAPPPPPDPVALFRRMGLIAHGGELPVTGRVSFVAGPSPDTTFAVLTLALPSRALTFTHTGADYRAGYAVDAEVRAGAAAPTTTVAGAAAAPPTPPAADVEARETVVVPTFRETLRTDESVLFQQVLRLAPGSYQLVLQVRDEGSERLVADTSALRVPRLGAAGTATPIPYYELVVRPAVAEVPRILATPRATVTFGRDSVLPLYLEAYGGSPWVQAMARGDGGAIVWRDSVALEPRTATLAAGLLEVPVSFLGIGATTVEVWQSGRADTARAPVFVTFGEDLPAASFEDMLSYLRYFTSPQRLEALRQAPVADRARAWGEFLALTDPDPAEPGHQGLQQYFARLAVANQRYRQEGGVGWLTDRGMVFTAFGDPEQVFEPSAAAIGQRNRVQYWLYRGRQLQLEFRDVNGFDRWELTPAAQGDFHAALRRLHP